MFKRTDGFLVWVPNYVVAGKALSNIRRAGMQSQRIEIQLPLETSSQTLATLSDRINHFVRNESRDFDSVLLANLETKECNKLTLVIILRHKVNFQDGPAMGKRSDKFFNFLRENLLQLGVTETIPPIRRVLVASTDQGAFCKNLNKH